MEENICEQGLWEILVIEWYLLAKICTLYTSVKWCCWKEESYLRQNGMVFSLGLRNSNYVLEKGSSLLKLPSEHDSTKVVIDMPHFEKWSERRPLVWHFRMFGCIAWAHVIGDKRKKIDAKSHACIVMGYSK